MSNIQPLTQLQKQLKRLHEHVKVYHLTQQATSEEWAIETVIYLHLEGLKVQRKKDYVIENQLSYIKSLERSLNEEYSSKAKAILLGKEAEKCVEIVGKIKKLPKWRQFLVNLLTNKAFLR